MCRAHFSSVFVKEGRGGGGIRGGEEGEGKEKYKMRALKDTCESRLSAIVFAFCSPRSSRT